MRWPNFSGPTFLRSQSPLVSPERCMNLYPQRHHGDRYALYPTPGLTVFATPAGSPGRAIFGQRLGGTERCFAVIGPTPYEVFQDGTTTSRGTVAVDGNPATLVANGEGGDELFIESGDQGYVLTLSTNVLTSEVADVTFSGMIDGYFVALDSVSSTLKISALLDGTTWDSTQSAQRSTASDAWRAMLVRYPRIWLLGEHTGDVWYNAGTAPFPFAPVQGVQIPYGIRAPWSLKTVGPAIMWLTQTEHGDRQVVEALGYTPTVVSTEALDATLAAYPRVDDAVAWTYQDQGHEFYVLNFPTADATWVYDRTEGLWHERGTWDATNGVFDQWGPQYHTFVFGKHLVLHAGNGTIYEMRSDLFTDSGGAGLRRVRVPQILAAEQKRVFVDRLELQVESGLGLRTGQGRDPQVLMRMSRTGGKVWGNGRSRSAGVLGAYNTRLMWHNCGAGRNMVPEFSTSDPTAHRWLEAIADVRVGAA